ncbi:conserved hypothetical protein [Segniliparus rotundus DSM 44985]|uniref:Uncharacterized protein n=1 Tax=Segniliparus rotundus (strain ATCC BAA-972 / CDC 1076 / CIP 108378 / DSM 44985 / JCM 13578) TaxID=640132 RepID=D6ZCE2_SEGRD|nr:hypothetical protein [Segniliparus rotundus]ADG99111.1 conserved hypothetical protein [Segniliparus rotundus DSM 44985]
MFLTPKISDQALAQALSWVVAVAVPLLDGVAETDPLHLKQREPGGEGSSRVSGAIDRAASFVQARELPGTAGWESKPAHERSRWWAKKIGPIGSAVASAPGVFGALSDRFPVQDAFGFATQAVTLCAVAREHGVRDREDLVRMLAEVLCGRTLDTAALAAPEEPAPFRHKDEGTSLPSWTRLVRGLWRITQIVRSVSSELEKRPRGSSFYRLLGKLPVVGAVGDFLHETGGVRRAVEEGERWLRQGGQPARGARRGR